MAEELRTASDEQRALRAESGRLETEVARLQARKAGLAEGLDEAESRSRELETKVESIAAEVAAFEAELEAALTAETEANEALEGQRKRRTALDADRAMQRDALQSAEVEVETARKELLRARSRLQSLEEIQQRYRGCQSGVQVVMEHREKLAEVQLELGGGTVPASKPEVHGIMADFVRAPERYEAAVSAVLGDRLQGVVVDTPITGASGVQLLKGLKEGRTTFLPAARPRAARSGAAGENPVEGKLLGWARPNTGASGSGIQVVDASGATEASGGPEGESPLAGQPGVLGKLTDLVELDGPMLGLADELLGGAVVVESLARALELWHGGARGGRETLVTLEGDRIEPSGVVVGGSPDAVDSALLQQKREIRELQEIVVELEAQFSTARAKQQGVAERVETLEQEREQSEREVLEAEKARLGATRSRESAQSGLTRVRKDAEQSRAQLENLSTQLQRRREERDEVLAKLEESEQKGPSIAEKLSELDAKVAELETARERLSAELTEAKVALARWQQESQALAGTKARIERQLGSERERARRLHEAAAEQEARIAELSQLVEQLGTEHGELLELHKVATAKKHDARESYDAAKVEVDELDVSVRNLRHQLEDERERFSEVELGLRELELEREHLVADVRDRFDDELRFLVTDYHHRPVAGPEQFKRTKELKKLIGRMGEVNLTAIEEFEEVSTRYEYLTGQRDDLESAINTLQEAIDRIDETTKVRFEETFVQVNEMFQKLFPRLFNGGRAELVMTHPDDLLNTGVEIMAQPPGKKIQSLELLSGGEKALTAVSLIFGIFLIKPSPFCLLDEVDAPLDEANVGRFCDMVRELSESTQFIIITHNKRTMEIADRLYGVTMQQRGVSKLVSVNMRKTLQEAQYS